MPRFEAVAKINANNLFTNKTFMLISSNMATPQALKRNRAHQFTFHADDGPLFAALQKLRNDSSRNFSGTLRPVLEAGLRRKYPELFAAKTTKTE